MKLPLIYLLLFSFWGISAFAQTAEPKQESISLKIEDAPSDTFPLIEEKEPDFNEYDPDVEEPEPLNLGDVWKLVRYPNQVCIEGTVVVRILVDKEGYYRKHKMLKDIHPILKQAVEPHLHKLRFRPTMKDGKPIMYWVNIPFRFKLAEE